MFVVSTRLFRRNVDLLTPRALSHFLNFAIRITKQGGNIIKEKRETPPKRLFYPLRPHIWYTETDIQVELYMKESIERAYKDHKIISEADSLCSEKPIVITNDPTWIIDPINGTKNYMHGFPEVAVSLALYMNKEPYLGVIYKPFMNQIYTCKKGIGSYMNGSPIHVSNEKNLENAFICLPATSHGISERHTIQSMNYQKFIPIAHGMRNVGSGVCNLTMVARGSIDVYPNFGMHIWQFAAGELLVTEAGGVAIDPAGGPLDRLSGRALFASSPELAQTTADYLTQYYPPRDG